MGKVWRQQFYDISCQEYIFLNPFSVSSVTLIIISIISVVIFIKIESICYVCLSTFFYFPHMDAEPTC